MGRGRGRDAQAPGGPTGRTDPWPASATPWSGHSCPPRGTAARTRRPSDAATVRPALRAAELGDQGLPERLPAGGTGHPPGRWRTRLPRPARGAACRRLNCQSSRTASARNCASAWTYGAIHRPERVGSGRRSGFARRRSGMDGRVDVLKFRDRYAPQGRSWKQSDSTTLQMLLCSRWPTRQ